MILKSAIRRLVPRSILGWYHFILSFIAAVVYGWPARRLIVVGVTGTKGKSTTGAMLWHILQSTGHKTGLISTAQLAIGDKTWLNDLKMTMPGRLTLQKLLRRMVRAGCTYLVLETSSEGLAQWRHVGIPYQVAVFTNLQPEHLESHGSYESYRQAKGRLFAAVAKRHGTAVVNLDDKEAMYFLHYPVARRLGYTSQDKSFPNLASVLSATEIKASAKESVFTVNNETVHLPVGGEFNIANALATLSAATALGIDFKSAVSALGSFAGTPGRLEFINQGQPFDVVVDYAHTPESLEALYKTLGPAAAAHSGGLIAVLGSCSGGRDRAKREPLGNLAGSYAKLVIVTDEDPYDEEPLSIMQTVARGALQAKKQLGQDLFIVPDRRQAIALAISKAKPGDVVAITGKGAEQWLCQARGKKIPWDDRQVVRTELGI